MARIAILMAAALLALPISFATAGPNTLQIREAYDPGVGKDLADTAQARAYRSALFGVSTVDDMARRGEGTVRIAVSRARAGLMPLVALEQSPGGDRLVAYGSVWTPAGQERTTLAYGISAREYGRLFRDATRVFAAASTSPDPAAAPDPTVLLVCMDGPTTVLEIAQPGQVRRVTEYCNELGIEMLAGKLAQRIVDRTSGCGAIQPYDDTPLGRLQLCLRLRGDRTAAVAAMNAVLNADLHDHPSLADLAASAMVFEGPDGRRASGAAAFRQAWKGFADKADARFAFELSRGVSSGRAEVQGRITWLAHPDDERRQQLESTQIWEKLAGRWRLTRWAVDSIDAAPPPR